MNWFKKLFEKKTKDKPTIPKKSHFDILREKKAAAKKKWEEEHPGEKYEDRWLKP